MTHNGRIAAHVRSEKILGVIGGSGFYTFFGQQTREVNPDTPYGKPSAPITIGAVGNGGER